MGDAINVFLFPGLFPSALLDQGWDAILGGGSLKSFAETILLLEMQRVEKVTRWEAVEKQIEAWGVLCHVLLAETAVHPATYELCSLVEETAYVGASIIAQTHWQMTLPVAHLHLLQTVFNESYCQVL